MSDIDLLIEIRHVVRALEKIADDIHRVRVIIEDLDEVEEYYATSPPEEEK